MRMIFWSIFFSTLSTIVMSYVTLSLEMGPWIAPVFIIVIFLFLIPLFNKQWLRKHGVIMVAAGSIGGMIGMCLAVALPAFYLLNKQLYQSWLSHPWYFISIIISFVFVATSCAFVMAYLLRYALIEKMNTRFAMSGLIHEMISVESYSQSRILIMWGIIYSSLWNSIIWLGNVTFAAYASQLYMMPMLASVGFVTGTVIALPLLIGLATRVIIVDWLFQSVQAASGLSVILMTFCSGILLAWFVHGFIHFISKKQLKSKFIHQSAWLYDLYQKKWFVPGLVVALLSYVVCMYRWDVSWINQWYLLLAMFWLGKYVVQVIAEIGFVELHSYVWFALFPLICFSNSSTLSMLAIALVVTLFLGITIDAVFAYKLAQLSSVAYNHMIRYQIIAVICSSITAAVFFWWYSMYFGLQTLTLFTQRAHDLANIIEFGTYNHIVFSSGFIYGMSIYFLIPELLAIIGAILMPASVTIWLIIPGALAHLIKNRQALYPVCFGVYAGNIIWLLTRVGL